MTTNEVEIRPAFADIDKYSIYLFSLLKYTKKFDIIITNNFEFLGV